MAALLGLVATEAHATLTLTTSNAAYHDTAASNLSASDIASDLGITTTALGTLELNTDGNSGPLFSSYSFSPNVSQALPITISYVGPTPILATYIYVKDGNMGSYLYNLGSTGTSALSWNGTDSIYITDLFGKGAGDLSHIEIFGSAGTAQGNGNGVPVPEPSTVFAASLLLIPFGLSALRIVRKTERA